MIAGMLTALFLYMALIMVTTLSFNYETDKPKPFSEPSIATITFLISGLLAAISFVIWVIMVSKIIAQNGAIMNIIDAITLAINNPNTGVYVVLGGVLAAVLLILVFLHLSIQAELSTRIDERIIALMREDGHNFDRDNK